VRRYQTCVLSDYLRVLYPEGLACYDLNSLATCLPLGHAIPLPLDIAIPAQLSWYIILSIPTQIFAPRNPKMEEGLPWFKFLIILFICILLYHIFCYIFHKISHFIGNLLPSFIYGITLGTIGLLINWMERYIDATQEHSIKNTS
jgi:hypothetical protein